MRRRGPAGRPDPRDHRPLRAVGAGDRAALSASTRCWRPTCSATASRRSRAATTRSAPTRAPSATRWSPSATIARRSSATRSAAGSRCSSPTSSPSAASGSCSSPAAGSGARCTRCCARRPCPAPSGCCRCSRTPSVLAAGEARRPRCSALLRLQAGTDLAEVARGFGSLGDAEARSAFIETMRAVLDPGASGSARSTASTWRSPCPRCSSGATPTRSSPSPTDAPRTRRCPAAGSSCSKASATSRSSSARTSSRACCASSSPRPSPRSSTRTTIRDRLLAGAIAA